MGVVDTDFLVGIVPVIRNIVLCIRDASICWWQLINLGNIDGFGACTYISSTVTYYNVDTISICTVRSRKCEAVT